MLTAITFSLFGFMIGVWATDFEKLQIVPTLIVTPLTFLGGGFYSISMLPPIWQKITLFNPVVYLISGFRWSFYGVSDSVPVVSFGATPCFLAACLTAVWWVFKTEFRLKVWLAGMGIAAGPPSTASGRSPFSASRRARQHVAVGPSLFNARRARIRTPVTWFHPTRSRARSGLRPIGHQFWRPSI